MTQIFAADGTVVPVTVVEAGPCLVVQKKTADKDGYDAVQIGLVELAPGPARQPRPRRATSRRPASRRCGRSRKSRLDEGDELKPGDKVLCDTFKEQDHVDVIGVSKGKGFAGVVARHHFRGGGGDARLDVPPRARLDRRLGVSLARHQGQRAPRAGWAAARRRRRTSSSCASTPRRTCSTSRGAGPGRAALARQDRALELRRKTGSKTDMANMPVVELEEGAGRRGRPARRRSSSIRTAGTSSGRPSRPTSPGSAPGTHKTKIRSEVSGSGKKPFKQKGTGRARQGGGRPPIHRHGGTVARPRRRARTRRSSRSARRRTR